MTSRTLGSILAGMGIAAAAILVSALPAQAHDELVAIDPASGTSIAELPAELTLSFSGDLVDSDGATVLQVTDAGGADLLAGPPVVSGASVTAPLSGEVTGDVTVLWKVVSGDGHPISGESSFTVTGAAAPSATPTPTPTPSAEAVSAAPSPSPSTGTTDGEDDSSAALPVVIASSAVAAGGAVAAAIVATRRRRREARSPADSDQTPER